LTAKHAIATPFTLGKKERLKSRKLIDQLFSEGKNFLVFPLRIYYFYPGQPTTRLQAGFTASSKSFKKAVDRNRIKRVMREAYRLQKLHLQTILEAKDQNLAIFFIYTARELPDYALIKEKMGLVLQKMTTLTDEAFPSNM